MSDDDEVGYGKPPKHTQFKKGQSGNPKGRPKHAKNFRTDMMEELLETIPVREGEHTFRISKQRALMKSLFAKGIKGETRAIIAAIELLIRIVGADWQPAAGAQGLAAEEREILEAFVNRVAPPALTRKLKSLRSKRKPS